MATITAQRILDENKWTISNITIANLEYLIDNAIDYINLETGLSISNLSGSPGSVTVTSAQAPVIKALSALLVRAYLEKGPQVGGGGINVTEISTDPHYKVMMMVIKRGINRLRGRSFVRT